MSRSSKNKGRTVAKDQATGESVASSEKGWREVGVLGEVYSPTENTTYRVVKTVPPNAINWLVGIQKNDRSRMCVHPKHFKGFAQMIVQASEAVEKEQAK